MSEIINVNIDSIDIDIDAGRKVVSGGEMVKWFEQIVVILPSPSFLGNAGIAKGGDRRGTTLRVGRYIVH